MSKKASPTLVGSFVVGAVALALAGVVAVGGGEIFQERFRCVAYFDESVAGLDVGAPIRFNGVRVGAVTDVRAVWSEEEETAVRIPVGLTFVAGAVHAPSKEVAERIRELGPYEVLERMIVRGLRAELRQDSFVTGKLFVALTFNPEAPIRRVGEGETFEIPTAEGGLSQLERSLGDLPVEQLLDQAIGTLRAIEERVESTQVDELLATLERALGSFEGEASSLADAARATLDEIGVLAQGVDAELVPALRDLRRVAGNLESDVGSLAASAGATLDEAHATLQRLNELGGEYTLAHRIVSLIDELTGAARALRVLADYLERHPEALLSGKTGR